MNTRIMKLEIEVEVPAITGERDVETAINDALNGDWDDWVVGTARIVDVRRCSTDETPANPK